MRGEFTIKYLKKYYLVPLLVIVIALWFTPRYNHFLYIAKHTITFIFLGLIAINITLAIFKDQLDNQSDTFSEKHYTLFRLLTVFSIVVSLTIIAFGQRNYILTQETPPIEGCYYYDAYGNYIHGSRLRYNCPVPEVTKTGDTLIMSFEYTHYGTGDGNAGTSRYEDTQYDRFRLNDAASKITVEVHYTDDHIIDYYRLREVTNYLRDDYTKTVTDGKETYTLANQTYITGYYEVIMDTTFNLDAIIQNKKIYYSDNNENVVESITDFTFNDFSDTNPTWEGEHLINYSPVSNNAYELMMYSYAPSEGYDEDDLAYEGVVETLDDTARFYIESDQTQPASSEFFLKSHTYTIDTSTNMSFLVTRGYYGINKYRYEDLSNAVPMPFLSSQNYISLYPPYPDDEQHINQKNVYNDFIFFESNDHDDYLLHETDYGYRVEQYGLDGVKDTSDLTTTSGEVLVLNHGTDRSIVSDSSNDLFYRNAPLLDYNPWIKYLLHHVSSET